jgi:hypothetical protein
MSQNLAVSLLNTVSIRSNAFPQPVQSVEEDRLEHIRSDSIHSQPDCLQKIAGMGIWRPAK